MMRMRALLVAGLLLLGCGDDDPVRFRVVNFPEGKHAQIRAAAYKWRELVYQPFREAPGGWIFFQGVPEPNLSGQIWRGKKITLIHPDVIEHGDDAELYGISLHEFGHMLGFDHVPVPGNVMCGKPEREGAPPAPPDLNCGPVPNEFGDADRAECKRLGLDCLQ